MSKFDRLATFIAVMEENGFSAAARKKGVSTAAISRQITALEKELGVQLIQRSTRQFLPTEIGSEYYQQAKQALVQLEDAETAIAGSCVEPAGILNVTSSRYFADKYLIPTLPEFMALNPKLKIKLELAERFPNLAEEGIDVIFGVTIEGPDELVRRRVGTAHYIMCASPDYLKQYGIPMTPTDLNTHRYITHTMRKPNNVVTFNGNITIHVEPVIWLNDSRVMCECAIQGMGIVKLHDYIVDDAIKDGSLVEILSEYREKEQSVYLYYQQSRYLKPKIRRFIDFYVMRAV